MEPHIPFKDSAGLLLMGGQSRRFGRDKALIEWDGEPLWQYQWRRLSEWVSPVFRAVSAVAPLTEDPAVLRDLASFPGPLPAIAEALGRCHTHHIEWLLVLAVDLPLVPETLIDRLYRGRLEDGVSLASAEGRWQPLCAFWHRNTLHAVQTALASDAPRIVPVVKAVPCAVWPLFGPERDWLRNLNYPEDYEGMQP